MCGDCLTSPIAANHEPWISLIGALFPAGSICPLFLEFFAKPLRSSLLPICSECPDTNGIAKQTLQFGVTYSQIFLIDAATLMHDSGHSEVGEGNWKTPLIEFGERGNT